MTLDDLIIQVERATPDGVAVTHSVLPQWDGVAFFFAGPKGLASAPFYGLTDKLLAGDSEPLLNAALQQAASVA